MSDRRRLLVRGRVQGVGYRYACAEAARALGVRGYVRNLADGGVEVVAAGSDTALTALEAWCRAGPVGAHVAEVELGEVPEGDLGQCFRIVG